MRVPGRPLFVALTTGAAVMALELLAPRLVARHLGTSAIVWSATFAVFLGGLALGNRAGGALADRFGRRALLTALTLGAAAALLAVPSLDRVAEDAFRGMALLPRALASLGLACLPAAILFGCVTPALATWALSESDARGRALGGVSAAGAVGSVLGTFATGFVLIPGMGTSVAIRAVAAAMVVAAAIPWIPRRAASPPAPPHAAERARRVRTEAHAREPARSPETDAGEPLPPGAIGALAALSGMALLVLEVLAGRTAPLYVGNGIYTWTAVVGVVLLGLAAGNAVGGILADRMEPRRALGLLFLVASVLVALTLWSPAALSWKGGVLGGSIPVRISLGVAVAWGPAAAALGAIPPVLARAAVASAAARGREGRAVGRVYALGTAGAIVGGVATSPWLVPTLGTSATLCAVAVVLALASRAAGRRAEGPWIAGVAVVGLAAVLPFAPAKALGLALSVRDDRGDAFVRESAYYRIRVDEPPPEFRVEGRRIRRLRLDALVHGLVDLDDPTWTGYGYEGVYAAVTERAAPPGRPLHALLLGGGPYAFARYLRATYAGSTVDVAEIDPAVTATAVEALALPHPETIRVSHEDARTFVRDLPADAPRYDLVYGDAFNDLSIPYHLTTLEFARAVKARMADDGVYVVNVIDIFDSGRLVAAFRETLARVFAHVDVTALDRDHGWQDNFVLVASDRAFDLDVLSRADPSVRDPRRRLPIVHYGPDEVAALVAKGRGLVLTDDYAPVENLLEPLLR